MREYTLQYLEQQDWVRVTAVYETFDSAMYHAEKLLADGKVIRLLARETNHSKTWYTVKTGLSGDIRLNHNVVYPE